MDGVIASRILIKVDVMVTMRNSGTGQSTIQVDGYLNLPGLSSDRIDTWFNYARRN